MSIATGFPSDQAEPGPREPLGQILKRMELVTETQIQEALEIQRKRGGVIGQILVGLGYVAEEEVLLALAAQQGMAIIDPNDLLAETLRNALGGLRETVRFERPEGSVTPAPLPDDLANSAPVVKLTNLILLTALKAAATELRLETAGDQFTVRFRVDGILYEMESPPLHLASPIIGRLLVESGLDISQRAQVQERRLRLAAAGREYQVRVQYAPHGSDGESIVLQFSDHSGAGGI